MKAANYVRAIVASVLFLPPLVCVQGERLAIAEDKADEHKFAVVEYKSESPAVSKLRRAIEEPTTFQFLDEPLESAMQELQERHGINIHIDKTSLEDEGIASDTAVTLELDHVSLRSALRMLLRDLGLKYVIENEVLLITTRSVADKVMDTRVYDMRQLPDIDSGELAQAINGTIRPGTECWKHGAMYALPTCLIITQSRGVHEEIADLMRLLIRHTENPRWKSAAK